MVNFYYLPVHIHCRTMLPHSSSVWSRYSNLNICIWHVWHTESVPCQQSHQESYPNHITLCYCKSVGNAKTFCRSNAIVICAFRGMKLQPHIPTTAPVSLVRWISNQRPPLYVEYCLFTHILHVFENKMNSNAANVNFQCHTFWQPINT